MKDIERLKEIVNTFRRSNHYYVDEDCWYSCPEHEDYCGEEDGSFTNNIINRNRMKQTA